MSPRQRTSGSSGRRITVIVLLFIAVFATFAYVGYTTSIFTTPGQTPTQPTDTTSPPLMTPTPDEPVPTLPPNAPAPTQAPEPDASATVGEPEPDTPTASSEPGSSFDNYFLWAKWDKGTKPVTVPQVRLCKDDPSISGLVWYDSNGQATPDESQAYWMSAGIPDQMDLGDWVVCTTRDYITEADGGKILYVAIVDGKPQYVTDFNQATWIDVATSTKLKLAVRGFKTIGERTPASMR